MYHDLPRDAGFWLFLFSIDQDLAESARKEGCPCGGRLHRANYPRKPRGGPDKLPEQYDHRLSFCCDRDGCRKRVTPPSVRFLGRKVYLGAVVILVAAMRQGPTPRRVRGLSRLFGADGHRSLVEPEANDVPADDSQRPDHQLPPLLKRILEEYSATGTPPAYLPKKPHPKKDRGEES